MHPTDLTVAAIIRKNDRYLLVEEFAMGQQVINQPGGHIESGESPEAAVVREVLEETGCTVRVGELVGVYLWLHPQKRQQFLRIIFEATYVSCDKAQPLDESIVARHWMTRDELEQHRRRLRTPVVLRCINDYEAGRRQSDRLLTGMLPLQHNVDAVLERADVV